MIKMFLNVKSMCKINNFRAMVGFLFMSVLVLGYCLFSKFSQLKLNGVSYISYINRLNLDNMKHILLVQVLLRKGIINSTRDGRTIIPLTRMVH